MVVCSRCGCEYDKEEVNLVFADVNRIPIDMCQECLERAYDDCEDGLFLILAMSVERILMLWQRNHFMIHRYH